MNSEQFLCWLTEHEEFVWCVSSGNDYTHVFGADPYSGTFVPAVYNCFKPHVKNVILDGEMVGYNEETKTIGKRTFSWGFQSYVTCIYSQNCFKWISSTSVLHTTCINIPILLTIPPFVSTFAFLCIYILTFFVVQKRLNIIRAGNDLPEPAWKTLLLTFSRTSKFHCTLCMLIW